MYNNYFNKYLKYKQKYLYLRYMTGGVSTELDKEAKNTEAEEVTNVNFIDPRSRKIYNIEISNNGIKVGDENVEVYNFKNIKIFEHNERTFMLYNNNIYMITSKGIIKYYNNDYIMISDNEYKELSVESKGINEEIRKKIVKRLYSDMIYDIEISNNGIKVGDENVEVYNFKNIKIFEHNKRTFMLYNNNIYMITSRGIIKYYNNIFGHIMIPDNEYKKLSDELIGINKEDNIKEEIRKKIVNRLYSDINKIIIGSESGKLRSFNEDYNNPRLIDTRTHFDHYRPQFEKMK